MNEADDSVRLDELPQVLPVFPLPGALLLPRGKLPLNIFEPRYLAMIRDAMASSQMIDMIQPRGIAEEDGHPIPRILQPSCDFPGSSPRSRACSIFSSWP